MVLRREVELVRLAEVAYRLIIFLFAGHEVGVGQIRQREHEVGILDLDCLELLVDILDFLRELLHLGEQRSYVRALFLQLRHRFRNLVLFGLQRLGLADLSSSQSIKLEYFRNLILCVLSFSRQSFDYVLGVLFDIFNVKHIGFVLSFGMDIICARVCDYVVLSNIPSRICVLHNAHFCKYPLLRSGPARAEALNFAHAKSRNPKYLRFVQTQYLQLADDSAAASARVEDIVAGELLYQLLERFGVIAGERQRPALAAVFDYDLAAEPFGHALTEVGIVRAL